MRTRDCEKCGEQRIIGKACAECARRRARAWYAANRERSGAATRAYKQTARGRAVTLASKRKWAIADRRLRPEVYARRAREQRSAKPEQHRAWSSSWYARNAAENRERNRGWWAAHPEARKVFQQRRRAREIGNGGSFSRSEWLALVDSQRGRCFDCARKEALTIGHLIPLSRGGRHDASNIVGQCRSCNSRQGRRIHPAAQDRAA